MVTREKTQFVAIVPTPDSAGGDVYEHFCEHDVDSRICPYDHIASEAVREAGLKTTRRDPETVKVAIHELRIEKGKLIRRYVTQRVVTPPMVPMTEAEYEAECKSELEYIPAEFHDALTSIAWEEGHSCGYENVIVHLGELVSRLSDPIKAFEKRLLGKRK